MSSKKLKSPSSISIETCSAKLAKIFKIKIAVIATLSLLISALVLNTHSFNNPLPQTAFAGTFSYESKDCKDTFMNLAGGEDGDLTPVIGIEVDDTSWPMPIKFREDGGVTYDPVASHIDTLLEESETDNINGIAKICYCEPTTSIDILYDVSKPPQATGTPDEIGAEKAKYKIRKQAAEWIRHHKNLFCKYIQTQTIESKPALPTQVTYCKIEQWEVEFFNLDIDNFRAFDTNNDCKIEDTEDENELCELELYTARQECSVLSEYPLADIYLDQIEGVNNENACQQLSKIYCDKGEKKILDLGEFDSTQLSTDTLRNTQGSGENITGQKGFQKIKDQGAGENNPAINFILNIINILTNLAFFVSMFFLIMGGFYMVMASNNSEMQDKGKNAIKYFVFGISFVLLSYLLVVLIEGFLF
jgi:hypothetical protein